VSPKGKSREAVPELVERARSRDQRAFAELVRLYERPLIAFLLGLTRNAGEAEEIAQDSFVRAYLGLDRLADPARFGSWLFGIARNGHREWSRGRRRELPPAQSRERTALIEQKALLHAEIYRLVQELPEPYAEVLLLRYFSAHSSKQTAALLGRPIGTITKQVSRAHAMLAERLKKLRGFTTMLGFFLKEAAE